MIRSTFIRHSNLLDSVEHNHEFYRA